MSEGGFVVPITADGGRILGWGRGDHPVAWAVFYRNLGTDLRFLRYADGEVYEISQEAKDAILAQDIASCGGSGRTSGHRCGQRSIRGEQVQVMYGIL
jgi:hypothetical protein